MKYLFVILALIISHAVSIAQTAHKLNIKGDKAYDKENYAAAEENYLKSYNEKSSYQSKYNLGNSLYKQDRYEEAIEAFDQATGMASKESERADSYYNLGTAQLRHVPEDPEVLDKAIASLKKAIKYDPTNDDARQNLFKAQVMKRIQQKQQEEQQQEQSQDQNQDQNQEENQDQEQQDSENQEQQDPSEQEQQEKENKENQENPADSSSQSSKVDTMSLEDLSKEEAERLLRIVEQEEKKIQDRLKRQQSNRNRPEKDW